MTTTTTATTTAKATTTTTTTTTMAATSGAATHVARPRPPPPPPPAAIALAGSVRGGAVAAAAAAFVGATTTREGVPKLATDTQLADALAKRRKSLVDLNRQFSSLFGSALIQTALLPTPAPDAASDATSTSIGHTRTMPPGLGRTTSKSAMLPSPVVKVQRLSAVLTPVADTVLPPAFRGPTIAPNASEELEIIREVGVGSFGTVSLVRHKDALTELALKVLEKNQSPIAQEQYDNERTFANKIDQTKSLRLIRLLATWEDSDQFYLLMDYCPGGDLYRLLSEYVVDEARAQWILAQMIVAIEAVHALGFAHRDIKPDNFLVDQRGQIKLCDFGFSVPVDADGRVTCMRSVGTPQYVAPEVLNAIQKEEPYSIACDWWSFGIVAYEVVLAFTPFDHPSVLQTHTMIRDHTHYFRWPETPTVSKAFRDLVESLVCAPSSRLDGARLRTHEYFTDTVDWEALVEGRDTRAIHRDVPLAKRTDAKPRPPPIPPPPARGRPPPPSFVTLTRPPAA